MQLCARAAGAGAHSARAARSESEARRGDRKRSYFDLDRGRWTALPADGRVTLAGGGPQRRWPRATAAWEAAPTGPRRRRTRARAVSLRLSTSAAAGPVL